jgi:ribosomal protein L22
MFLQAAANAKENLKMSKLNLYISECYADSGPAFKRFSHGYKGR